MPATRKKTKHQPPKVPVERPQTSFWETRAVPFLEAHALLLALCLIAIGTIRIVVAYSENGITFDEPGHMACGLQFLAKHVYLYESQHPPLARVMSALGPYLEGARPMGIANQDDEGVAVMYHTPHVLRTLILMRLGLLPFFFLACLVVYFWGDRYFGKPVAVVATALFTLVPPVLAHAGVATTDIALTACLGAAFLALVQWAEKPELRQSLWLGAATGLAVLSKFTALAFFPAAALLALAAYWVIERPGLDRWIELAKKRALSFIIAVATGAVVIWAGYLFSFGKVPGWSVPLPAPEVFDGVRSALSHNDRGHVAYLLGQLSQRGWWYYFPVVLAVKTPLAFLLLLALGTWLGWRNRRKIAHWLPWALSLGILVPAMMGHVNIGVRHILPVYIGFSITAAVGLVQLLAWAPSRKWLGSLAAALLLWTAVSGALNHPNYLAYFNEFAGSHPEQILVDSDLDWGQDTVRLARWLQEANVPEVSFITMNLASEQLRVWPGLPPAHPINPLTPAEGWTVVSPTLLIFNEYGLNHRYAKVKPWFEYLRPVGKVGSFILYYVPPGSLRRKS